VSPELEFLLGPGWKIGVVLFGGGALYAKVNTLGNDIRSFRRALFGENGDGPLVVTNKTCLERENRLLAVVREAKGAVDVVDGKVEDLREVITDVDGRLRVVESHHPT
jgi:hypothetical protein